MKLANNLPAVLLKSLSAGKSHVIKKLSLSAMVLAACGVSSVHADAALTYELTGDGNSKTVKQFSMARFFIRIDDPADKDQYLLFQAGKFFPLFSVDQAKETYTRLTPPVTPYMGPDTTAKKKADTQNSEAKPAERAPAPKLKPTGKKRKVAGIQCRVVHEISDDKPVIEHCMANSAKLGLTSREVITMARMFEMAPNRDLGWLGVGTEDEEFISIQSKDLSDNRVLSLTAVSTKPLPEGYLRIPREYKEIGGAAEAESLPDSGQAK
jgi:hypothetical protein